jgi:hypothetical protein
MIGPMARQESEREDLLHEATALVERIELVVESGKIGRDEHVLVGFRRNGCASLYFGSDPVFHFNSRGQLRRAHASDCLLKAQCGKLVSMRRARQSGQVQLLSRTLDGPETDRVLRQFDRLRCELAERLRNGDVQVVGEMPADANVMSRVAQWLNELRDVGIAESTHVR